MAYSFNGTSSYIVAFGSTAGTLETTYPMSMSCWFYAGSTAQQGLLSITSSSNARNIHLEVQTDGTIAARTRSGSDSPAFTTTSIQLNTWNHALGVYFGSTTTNTSRAVYLNGLGKGTAGTSVTVMGLQNATINIGSRLALTTRSRYFSGRIAEVAFWKTSLTDEDALQLATGVSALKVRPQSLVFYAPIIRDLIIPFNERARFVGGAIDYDQLSSTAATVINDHPRRYG